MLKNYILDRIVTDPSGCWNWRNGKSLKGYGRAIIKRREYSAHRVSYEAFVGPIPAGLTIDHLCRNRACVNPEHLEPVSNETNVARGVSFSARNAAKTHCDKGHAFTPENTRIRPSGWRECRACYRATQRDRYARLKAAHST